MELKLKVEGALPEELQRGIDAAWAVFRTHGVNPVDAANGMQAMEQWDDFGFPADGEGAMSDEDGRLADIWMEAMETAARACCASWTEVPPYHMELILTDAEKAEYGW
jgi:hypothetical protein